MGFTKSPHISTSASEILATGQSGNYRGIFEG